MRAVYRMASAAGELELLQREWDELRKWSRFGAPIALFGWVGGLYGGGGFERNPVLVGLLAVAMLLLTILRIGVLWVAPTDAAGLRRALSSSWILLLFSVISWSLCTIYLYWHAVFGPLMMAVTIGISLQTAAYTYAFAGRHALGLLAVPLLYAPTLLHYWSQPDLRISAMVTSVSFVYLMTAALQVRRDWLERLRLEQTIRRQATDFEMLSKRDWLTGLDNRRSFIGELEAAITRPERHVSLLMLDIDHFKRINDEFGHAAGDHCLIVLGSELRQACASSKAVCARIGGDEFSVLLPGQSLEQALALAEIIRDRLAARPHVENGLPRFTVSIGVGEFMAEVHSSEDAFIATVDAALYRAKNYGRDQVRCSIAMSQPAPK